MKHTLWKKSLILNEDRFSVSLHLDSCAECYHLCNLGLRTWLYYCVLQTAKCGKLLDLHRSAIHLSNSTIKGSSYNESWGIPLVGGGFSWCPSTSDQNRTLEINFGKRLDLLWVRSASLWNARNFKGKSLELSSPIRTLLKRRWKMQNRRCQLFCSLLLLMWDYTIALQIRGFGGSAILFFQR